MLTKERFGILFICLTVVLTAALIPQSALAQLGRLTHQPVNNTPVSRSVHIEAILDGGNYPPITGRIFYRQPGDDAYVHSEMDVDGWKLSGMIPAEDVMEVGLEYYIEAELPDDQIITFPEDATTTNRPIRVTVVPIGAGESFGEVAVLVLNPEPGTRVSGEMVTIAISLLQHIRKLPISDLRIELDGVDLTGKAIIGEEIVSLVVEDLDAGEHRVALFVMANGRKEKLVGWGFLTVGKVASSMGMPFNINATAGYSYEDVSEEIRNTSYLDGKIYGGAENLNWAGRAYVTSLERGYLQPQHRFTGSFRYKGLSIRVGDVNPRFSEFSLWGVRNRGVEFNMKSPYFNLGVAWGYLRRPIDGILSVVPDEDGNPITSPVTGLDSTAVSNWGTFRRSLLAIQPGFPISRNSTLTFNILKIKDEMESIDNGKEPNDNLVLGINLQIRSSNRRLTFTTETSVSMYNSNITDGAMKDAKDFENIIVINQHFKPLPADSSILATSESGEGLSTTELAKKLFAELIESSMAHRTTLKMIYFNNEVSLGFKTIGKSYKSLGSPTVLTDVKGFSVRDRIRLLNNRVYLSVGYESYQDNINGRGETTLDKRIISTGIAVYTAPAYPNFNFNLRLYGRENDGETTTYELPDGEFRDVDKRIDNSTTTYGFGIDQSFDFQGFTHLAALSLNNTTSADAINPIQETELNSINLRLMSRQDRKIELNGSFSTTVQNSLGGDYEVTYNSFSLGGRYTLMPEQLWVSAGLNTTMADGGNDNPEPDLANPDSTIRSSKLKYSRLEFSVGGEYRINEHHEVFLNAYKVGHSDDGYDEYWSSRQEHNKDSVYFISQNDLVTRLRYTYKF